MGVFFLLVGLFFGVIAYVAVKMAIYIIMAFKRKRYKNGIGGIAALLVFFLMLYLMYDNMYHYADKVFSDGMN